MVLEMLFKGKVYGRTMDGRTGHIPIAHLSQKSEWIIYSVIFYLLSIVGFIISKMNW